ncbi:MAG: carboxypeptidase regulatory-like domain-containing protein [Caldilineae bacterium]|nr:carboxypeptidase regulatory-like domain-containing protein [Chloroflexota bacterium]MCB9177355.1 carboxypeptidase regulatory-like domain-containing protein [Caldilineae bacterium]
MSRPAWMRRTILLPLALVVAGALPARAQVPAEPDGPQPSLTRAAGSCLDVGLALAAVSQDGSLAEAIALPSPNASLTAAGNSMRRIVVEAPALVGACADFEGVWGDGTAASLGAKLTLQGAATSVVNAAPMARDAVEERGKGPRRLERVLRAQVKLEKPGRYPVTALLEVAVDQAATIGSSAGPGKRDAVKVPFVIEVREPQRPKPEPKPAPVAGGAVSGRVLDADGAPIAKALVLAAPRATGALVPPPSTSRRPSTFSDENGDYRLELPVGSWALGAMRGNTNAAGGPIVWWDGRVTLEEADPVTLADGDLREGIDFRLP